jgi:hypothetical protein
MIVTSTPGNAIEVSAALTTVTTTSSRVPCGGATIGTVMIVGDATS